MEKISKVSEKRSFGVTGTNHPSHSHKMCRAKRINFTSKISRIILLLLLSLLLITALPNAVFAAVPPPSMTASFAANGSVNVNTGNSAYAQKITDVKIDGVALPDAFDNLCTVSNTNLNIDAYCFQTFKEYTITIIATGYNNATVLVSNILSAPSMTASFASNGSVNVNTGNSTYAQKITDVKIDGVALPDAFDNLCTVSNTNLNIDAYCFQTFKEYTITIIATGYNNATVLVSNILSAPSMTASFAANGSVNVNTGNSAYAQKITDVKIDGVALPNSFDELCNVTNANLNIDAYCFQSTKAYTITIIATGYKNATVTATNVLSPPSMYVFPFTDIADSAWYRNDVQVAHRSGLINGITPTTFAPANDMTIAEAIKLAACMHQLYNDGSVTLANGKPQWYSSYVTYSLTKGIISGAYPDYNKKITRREFVNVFYNALPVSQYGGINMVSNNNIPDVPMSSQYADKIYAFYRAGILVGSDSKGTFYPSSNILRSEVAAILSRMFDDTVRKIIALP